MKEIAIAGAALLLLAGAPFNANAQKVVGWDGGAEPAHAVDAGTPKADFQKDFRGFAIKLLDVPGDKIAESDEPWARVLSGR